MAGMAADGKVPPSSPAARAAPEEVQAVSWSIVNWTSISLALLQAVASCAVIAIWGLGDEFREIDARETQSFRYAVVVIVTAMVLEACYLASATSSASGVHLQGSHTSLLVCVNFLKKFFAFSIMATGTSFLAHRNMRAWGPSRPCYALRYLDWAIGVPWLALINNYVCAGDMPRREFLARATPAALLTAGWVLTGWVALITPSPAAGWAVMVLCGVCYVFSCVEQWNFAQHVCAAGGMTHHRSLKLCMCAMKEVVFALYGVVYLLGTFNVMTPLGEQLFYTYGDMLLKVGQEALLVMIRNKDDLETIREALEMKVTRTRQDVQRLIENASAPILSVDAQGIVVAWNAHLVRVSQIDPQEAIGRYLPDLVDAESRGPLLAAISASAQHQSAAPVEITLLPPRGGRLGGCDDGKPVQLVMSFVDQLGGDTSGLVAVGQDLTELAAMKTAQSKRALLTAMVGHELRSPLHGIMGLSGAMAEVHSDGMLKKQLSMIKGCAARLLDLVTNIMEMAKTEKQLENASVQLVGEVNFLDIVDEVIGMTVASVDKSGKPFVPAAVKVVNAMGDSPVPLVRGDAYKCTQLVYNLMTNACKFTRQGTVTVSCRHDKAGEALEVIVADTGCGVPEKALARIFEPFEQEETKDARAFQGIGLGLSVVQNIVKLHRGTISVSSKVDAGTTFTVSLPCDNTVLVGRTHKVQAEEGKAHSPSPVEPAAVPGNAGDSAARAIAGPGEKADIMPIKKSSLTSSRGNKLPLLLSVTGDKCHHDFVKSELAPDFRIEAAWSGEEAVQYLTSGKELPAVILMDTLDSGTSQFETCRRIREKLNYGHLGLPVVTLSDVSQYEQDGLLCFRAGATDHLQRPVNVPLLKLRLTVLAKQQSELASATLPSGSAPLARVLQEKAVQNPTLVAPAAAPTCASGTTPALEEACEAKAHLAVPEAKAPADPDAKAAHAALLEELRHELLIARAECDELRAQVVEAPPPPPTPANNPGAVTTPRTAAIARLTRELGTTRCDLEFYVGEVRRRDSQIEKLNGKWQRARTDALLSGARAESLTRQLHHERLRARLPLFGTSQDACPPSR